MTPIPFLDPPPAIVQGDAASGLARLLQRAVARGELEVLPEAVRARTIPAIQAIDLASRAWERRRATSGQGSANGSTEAQNGAGGSYSPHDLLSASEAAVVLNVSERQARTLAGRGLGRQVAGRWMLDRSAVEDEAQRRGVT